jgi:hypothetical protein
LRQVYPGEKSPTCSCVNRRQPCLAARPDTTPIYSRRAAGAGILLPLMFPVLSWRITGQVPTRARGARSCRLPAGGKWVRTSTSAREIGPAVSRLRPIDRRRGGSLFAHRPGVQYRDRLSAGGKWIRTAGPTYA